MAVFPQNTIFFRHPVGVDTVESGDRSFLPKSVEDMFAETGDFKAIWMKHFTTIKIPMYHVSCCMLCL